MAEQFDKTIMIPTMWTVWFKWKVLAAELGNFRRQGLEENQNQTWRLEIDAEDNSMKWDIIIMEVDEDWEEDVDVAIAVDVEEADDNDDDVLRRRSFVYLPPAAAGAHVCPRFGGRQPQKVSIFCCLRYFPSHHLSHLSFNLTLRYFLTC